VRRRAIPDARRGWARPEVTNIWLSPLKLTLPSQADASALPCQFADLCAGQVKHVVIETLGQLSDRICPEL
jgi:hypothetical protein